MKNIKGFTLTEILAVIIVLSLIMIIAIPVIQNTFLKTKEQISSINKKNIEEAAKIYANEIIYCTPTLIPDCNELKEQLISNEGIVIKLAFLVDNNYYANKAKCQAESGTEDKITIKANEEYQINVELENIICKQN